MTQTDLINRLPNTIQEWEYKPPGYIHFYLRKCNQCPLVMLALCVLFTFTTIILSAKQTFFRKIICKKK